MDLRAALPGHEKDLGGGLRVRRLLPAVGFAAVGPFVFFDHFGPMTLEPHANVDVRPHPHIGLATLSYLFAGELVHRDSLGSVARIAPGAVNWMSAGRGIVHSERRPPETVAAPAALHGLQFWVALPAALEESPPSFMHVPAAAIPTADIDGVGVTLVTGEAFGRVSPVPVASPTLCVLLTLGARPWPLPALAPELAAYPLDADLTVGAERLARHALGVLEGSGATTIAGPPGSRVVLLGGAPLAERRHLWWNFVSSRRDRLATAAADWAAQRMGTIPGETEWMPLPEPAPRP
jgi:redox-sensitive bicupin YhaK (pirin superfamily)